MSKSAILLGALAATASARVSYDDHFVIRCNPDTRDKLDVLHNLESRLDLNLDIWQEARSVNRPVDIMVSKDKHPLLEEVLKTHDIGCKTMVSDVESAISNERRAVKKTDSFFDAYHNWTDVHAFIDGLAEEFPSLAKTSTIGNTYEGKPQKIITMSTNPGAGKPALWFDGGLHAREWIAVATVSYIADTLLRGYGSNTNSTYLLDTFDVIICPILNVDGYAYTWDEDRMWRKTRSPNEHSRCDGTDPNRNWAFHWGEAGTSPQPCSDSYEGASAASEVEVQNVQSYLVEHKDSLVGYVNFHSYSQEWMSPWGYTDELPEDYPTQNALSKAVTESIYSVHQKEYIYGPIATTIYPASGSSADFTYGVCGIVYSYGVELRDTGEFGFLLPAEEIVPSGEEIWAGVVTMGQFIDENALQKK